MVHFSLVIPVLYVLQGPRMPHCLDILYVQEVVTHFI